MADSHFYTSLDGLKLHIRQWGTGSDLLPIVCLPGLTRNHMDFDSIAQRLSTKRQVIAFDYRGRGLSQRDPDWTHYDLLVENADILKGLAELQITQAIILGTSRGGLHAMLFTLTQPALLRGVILNDIGPVIEPEGLKRIRAYVGKYEQPKTWDEAIAAAKRAMGSQFTNISEEDWRAYVQATFTQTDGAIELSYDPALSKGLEALNLDAPLPSLWPQFGALAGVPVMCIRGETSYLLSEETVTQMAAQHPNFTRVDVPGQGHAPLLRDESTQAAIEKFIALIDTAP